MKIAGPRFAGKSSIVQWLLNKQPIDPFDAECPTEGTEITKVVFEQTQLILYDCENYEEEDYVNAKWINMSANSVQIQQPRGIIFVIDGNDPGRLALAAKILRDLVDRLYNVNTILILVTKSDLYLKGIRSGSSDDGGSLVSPRFLSVDNTERDASTVARAVRSPGSRDVEGSNTNRFWRAPEQQGGAETEDILRERPPSGPRQHRGVNLQVLNRIMNHPSLMQKDWSAHYCSAVTGDGLDEAFAWFTARLQSS